VEELIGEKFKGRGRVERLRTRRRRRGRSRKDLERLKRKLIYPDDLAVVREKRV